MNFFHFCLFVSEVLILGRIRLFFAGLLDFEFPKDFDDKFSFLFVEKINKFIEVERDFENYTFFTFSDFVIEQVINTENSLISTNGIVSVVLSSVDDKFLKKVTAFLLENDLRFDYNKLSLFKFEFLENVDFSVGESNFICVSPIYLKNFPKEGNMFSFLENSLKKNYCIYHNLKKCDLSCEIFTNGDYFKEYVEKSTGNKYDDHYYFLDLYMQGDAELISFAYDAGLGYNTNKGFGMLDLY